MEKNQLIRQILNENNLSNLKFDDIIKKELIFPLIDLLIEQKERHSEFNFEKILLITLLLSKKVKQLQIITNPVVLSFTATVIWHSVLNRPGSREYLMQEELDKKFERSISAVRYLRQELGISNKIYYNLENFIGELENATSLKEQKAINYRNVDLNKYEIVKNFISEVIIKRKKARSAIECSTFLYFNDERAYTKKEIWYAIENQFFNLEGTTPRSSFNSDISRYCDNSVVGNKRKPLLFTILNLYEKAHRIQLILDIRNKIDEFLGSSEYGNYMKVSNIPLKKIATESREIPETEKIRKYIQKIFSTGSKNAIECFVFLFFHKEKAYSDGEIWENVKVHVNSPGKTPNRTFATEIRKYTDNSPQILKVSHTKLFTIKNYGETPQKFQLIEEVRNKLDMFFNEGESEDISDEVINVISNKLGKTINIKVEGVEFIFQGRGAYAILNYFNDRFILSKKSIITKMYAEYFPEKFSGLFNLRKKLIENGILEKRTDDKYNLMKNLKFRSPSPCACFCAGASYNGYTAFKLKTNKHITLKEYITEPEITEKTKLELEPTKKDEHQKIDNIHLLSTQNLGPLSSVINKLKYYDFNEKFTVEDLLSVNSELEEDIFQSLIVNFLKLLENPLINGVKQNTKGEYRLVANTNKIINKINDISLVLQNSLSKYEKKKIQKINQKSEVEHLVEEPKEKPIILAIYKDNMVMSKKDIEYFIPEISAYLSNRDQSLTREFFKSEAYKWRRKFQILNINNEEKIKIYFDQLKSLSLLNKINLKLSDVDLIIDLNEHKLYYVYGWDNLDAWKNIKFSYFKIQALDDIAFKNLLDKINK